MSKGHYSCTRAMIFEVVFFVCYRYFGPTAFQPPQPPSPQPPTSPQTTNNHLLHNCQHPHRQRTATFPKTAFTTTTFTTTAQPTTLMTTTKCQPHHHYDSHRNHNRHNHHNHHRVFTSAHGCEKPGIRRGRTDDGLTPPPNDKPCERNMKQRTLWKRERKAPIQEKKHPSSGSFPRVLEEGAGGEDGRTARYKARRAVVGVWRRGKRVVSELWAACGAAVRGGRDRSAAEPRRAACRTVPNRGSLERGRRGWP